MHGCMTIFPACRMGYICTDIFSTVRHGKVHKVMNIKEVSWSDRVSTCSRVDNYWTHKFEPCLKQCIRK